MSKVAVFATLRAQPGKRDELVRALQPVIDAVGTEEGTELYIVHVSDDEPDVVRFYELYRDRDALALHSASEAMKEAGGKLATLLAGRPEIVVTTPTGAKGVTLD